MHLCRWKRALHCPPWAAMIRHQTSTSGHLCCNTESLPHHPRIQSQNYTKIPSMQTSDRKQSQCEYITTPVGLHEHFFHLFYCKVCIFVAPLPLQTWEQRASCTEFPAATAQTRAVACQSTDLNMQNAENSHNTSFLMLMNT